MVDVKHIMESNTGAIIVSVVLGLGLAALFRKACVDGKCIVIKGPPRADTDQYFYKIDNDCYKYTPVAIECVNPQSK